MSPEIAGVCERAWGRGPQRVPVCPLAAWVHTPGGHLDTLTKSDTSFYNFYTHISVHIYPYPTKGLSGTGGCVAQPQEKGFSVGSNTWGNIKKVSVDSTLCLVFPS